MQEPLLMKLLRKKRNDRRVGKGICNCAYATSKLKAGPNPAASSMC